MGAVAYYLESEGIATAGISLVRDNTERPVTVTEGTNRLVSAERSTLMRAVHERLAEERGEYAPPERWDGQAATRIVDVLEQVVA